MFEMHAARVPESMPPTGNGAEVARSIANRGGEDRAVALEDDLRMSVTNLRTWEIPVPAQPGSVGRHRERVPCRNQAHVVIDCPHRIERTAVGKERSHRGFVNLRSDSRLEARRSQDVRHDQRARRTSGVKKPDTEAVARREELAARRVPQRERVLTNQVTRALPSPSIGRGENDIEMSCSPSALSVRRSASRSSSSTWPAAIAETP